MTYSLRGGEIVEARVASSSKEVVVSKLRWLGVQVFKDPNGAVRGQVQIDPDGFTALEGVRLTSMQRFSVVGGEKLQILAPSPLARCRPVPLLDLQSHDELVRSIEFSWREVVGHANQALDRARVLSKTARLLMDPWRIEGTVDVGGEEVRLLFSAQGDRACVCGLSGRALVSQPAEARVILPVRHQMDAQEAAALWRAAIAQARACLGPALPEPEPDHVSLSLDLASQDLENSYGSNPAVPTPDRPPGMVGPGQVAPTPVVAGRVEVVPRLAPMPVDYPPRAEPDDDSLDLASLDLSADLDSLDLP